MRKVFDITAWIKFIGCLLAAAVVLAGCQGALLSYKGEKVRQASRIPLADGIQKNARYQSSDLTIEYYAMRNGDDLQVSGVVTFTPAMKNNYVEIPAFHLSVFLIDPYGNILQENGIVTPGSQNPSRSIRFREKIKLPPGTANMAFSYFGEARGGGRQDRGATTPFREIPIVE